MRLIATLMSLMLTTLIATAVKAQDAAAQLGPATVVGYLDDAKINEASGLAASNLHDDQYWIINDGGAGPYLYATDQSGQVLATLRIDEASNLDWEDLASFVIDGQSMLLIADIGDNMAMRNYITLYAVSEPNIEDELSVIPIAWEMHVQLPDGASDAESVSVDTENGNILILTKRDIPAVLFKIPLPVDMKTSGEVVIASAVTRLETLPPPTPEDIREAPARKSWHWQPTAMDISPAGDFVVILSYRGVYLYSRQPQEDWQDTFARNPSFSALGDFAEAESAAFSAAGDAILVTTEKRFAPMLRFAIH